MRAALAITEEPPLPKVTRHIAERMAEAILERMKQTGHCSILDLRDMGFSLDEVARYWPEAWEIIRNKQPRPIGRT